MSWHPDATVEHSPQLDAFRRVAAEVLDGDRLVTYLVCEVQTHYMVASGYLWWRCWTAKEIVYGREFQGDSYDDWVADPDHPISAVFLRDLLDGWYRERDYDVVDTSVDQEAPVMTEYRVRRLHEPERSNVLQDSDL